MQSSRATTGEVAFRHRSDRRRTESPSQRGAALDSIPTKTETNIKPFWYSDVWLFPELVTIITTLDRNGRLNAAPYSHIMQYDSMHGRPRMMLGFRQDSHTFENICATGELVIDSPPAAYLEDVMETARFYPEGVNELVHTRFTTVPSRKVKPPSIAECPQIAECTVDEIVKLEKSSGIVIANIEAIVVDEGLDQVGREERIRRMDLPIGLGDEDRQEHFYTRAETLLKSPLNKTPDGYRAADLSAEPTWDDDAMQGLMKIPALVRKMVMKQTEKHARKQNAHRVTKQHMMELAARIARRSALGRGPKGARIEAVHDAMRRSVAGAAPACHSGSSSKRNPGHSPSRAAS